MRVLLLILLFFPCSATAWEDWSDKTKDSFTLSTNWILLDWHSTDLLARDGWKGYKELNPILGPNPTQDELAVYMLARVGLNYWMHDQGWGRAARLMSIGHALAAVNNYSISHHQDKLGHVFVGAAVSEFVTYETGSRLKGCVAAFAVGIIKEAIDSRTHNFDPADAAATGLGCSIFRIEF